MTTTRSITALAAIARGGRRFISRAYLRRARLPHRRIGPATWWTL